MADEGAAVPAAQKSSWSSFLKSIASATGDLSSMTAPPFILSPTSLAEFPSYWGEPTQQFAAIASGKTPEERALLVLEWYVSTLAGQFTRREKETGSEKKPLNPFLGEQFLGEWNNGELVLHAEQVSHHPPITAYLLENASKGVSYEGNCAQKTSFHGTSITVKQVGHGLLRVRLSDGSIETYLITLPKLRIDGILTGSPYVELTESSYIQSSAGILATIEYSGKGWVSGKAHSFTATVTRNGHHSNLAKISGVWTGESKFAKGSAMKEGQLFLNADLARSAIQVKPIEQQNEFESRRAWKAVADGIRGGNFDAASAAKTQIENAERQKRKDEAAAGKPFETRLFKKLAHDPTYAQLANMAKYKPENEDSYNLRA